MSAIRTAEADDAFLAVRDVGVHRIQASIGRDPLMYGFAANGTRSLFEEAGFSYEPPKGKKNCVMRRIVSPVETS